MPDGRTIQSVPVEADGCVFTGTSNATVLAVNATTGRIVWSNRLAQGGGGNPFVGAGIIGAPAVVNGLVYVAVTAPAASIEVALDEVTGALV
jgi:outer membrane protein assembly factor BamB